MRKAILLGLFFGSLPFTSTQAQSTRHWITETTVTWGRGRFAYQGFGTDAVALADLGLRWSYPSQMGWGLSFAGGYDFPSEASLVGGRARVTRQLGRRRLEGSLAVLVSSIDAGHLGGIVGAAFYPKPWGAFVLQLDLMPTRPPEGDAWTYVYDQFGQIIGQDRLSPPVERAPTASFGLRLADGQVPISV